MSGAVRTVDVVVVGGGQAGLATSWLLTREGVDHVVLEAGTVAHEWADTRWDNFTLVTPNWQCRLPGYAYDGPDPDGFMTRDEVVAWLAGYAATFDPPVREHATVTALQRVHDDPLAPHGFELQVARPGAEETWRATHVVVATGGYHLPLVPPWAPALDPGIVQLHSADYRNAAQLPDGDVLVVGSGQSGAQIAEDLHLEGRGVHLALGDAPRVARTYRGRDCMTWLADMGLYDAPVAEYPGGRAAREKTNHYVTGRDGGRDIDLRAFAREGLRLYGLVESGGGTRIGFRPTVRRSLDAADAVYNSICRDIDAWIEREGIDAPPGAPYEPVWQPEEEPVELDLAAAGVGSVVWAIGYRPDYRWMHVGVFDGSGRPVHTRGVTAVPGLCFLGIPWLHTWGSGRFLGVAADAEYLVTRVVADLRSSSMPVRSAG